MSELTFARVRYRDVIEEAKPLLVEHHKELALYQGDIPLAPDYEFFARADDAGAAVTIVGRTDAGAMVGYALYFIKEHQHYMGHKWAVSDLFWLAPEYRRFGNGKALFRSIEAELKLAGAAVMHTTLKVSNPAAKYLLESMGHTLVEYGLSKRL